MFCRTTLAASYRMRKPFSGLSMVFFVCFFSSIPVLGQCSKDIDCKGDRICVRGECVEPTNKTADEQTSPSPLMHKEPGSAGWARGAAMVGYIASPVILGLTIGSAATTGDKNTALPLGISAFSIAVASLPIITIGGASARHGTGAKGSTGLRIVGLISYGLALINGAVMIGIAASSDVSIPSAPILTCGILGSMGCLAMATDAEISAKQASQTSVSEDDTPGTWSFALAPRYKGMKAELKYTF